MPEPTRAPDYADKIASLAAVMSFDGVAVPSFLIDRIVNYGAICAREGYVLGVGVNA